MRDYISETIEYAEEHVGFKVYVLDEIAFVVVMGDKNTEKFMNFIISDDNDDIEEIIDVAYRVGYECYVADIRSSSIKKKTRREFNLATQAYREKDDNIKKMVGDVFITYMHLLFLKTLGDTGNDGEGENVIQKICNLKESIFKWPLDNNEMLGWDKDNIDFILNILMSGSRNNKRDKNSDNNSDNCGDKKGDK